MRINPELCRQRQGDCQKFKASLGAMWQDVSKQAEEMAYCASIRTRVGPAFRMQRQADLNEFKARPVYTVGSRPRLFSIRRVRQVPLSSNPSRIHERRGRLESFPVSQPCLSLFCP